MGFGRRQHGDIDKMFATTPLIDVVEANDIETAAALLRDGADVNEPDSEGTTPLMYAVLKGNDGMVKLLLEYLADVRKVNRRRDTALSMCAASTTTGTVPTMKMLLASGANVNTYDCNGRTPLMLAVMADRPEFLSVLAEAGADLHIGLKPGDGGSLLGFSALRCRPECFVRLIQLFGGVSEQERQRLPKVLYKLKEKEPDFAGMIALAAMAMTFPDMRDSLVPFVHAHYSAFNLAVRRLVNMDTLPVEPGTFVQTVLNVAETFPDERFFGFSMSLQERQKYIDILGDAVDDYPGEVLRLIERDFGSFENFVEKTTVKNITGADVITARLTGKIKRDKNEAHIDGYVEF